MSCYLIVSEDNPIYASGLQDEFGNFINDAVVTFSVEVDGIDEIVDEDMEYVEDSDGTYRGELLDADLSIEEGETYTITVDFEWVDANLITRQGQLVTVYTGAVKTTQSGVNVYATCSDLDMVFGHSNVQKWADLDNDGDEDTIRLRTEWALNLASRKIDDRLRGGPYVVPFQLPYPASLTDITAKAAGVLLYEGPRGLADSEDGSHALQGFKDEVQMWLGHVLDGRVRLVKSQSGRAPRVVKQTTSVTRPTIGFWE